MSSAAARAILRDIPELTLLKQGTSSPASPALWDMPTLTGCLTELSGRSAGAPLTVAFWLVLDAQQRGEPVAWLTGTESTFYPPDVAAAGVDLEALVVIRLAEAPALLRAAAHLARSGAFGLLVLDLGEEVKVPAPALTLLVGHAQKHHMVILFLTHKGREVPSLASLIAVRAEALRVPSGEGAYLCRVEVLKDKRRGPGWSQEEVCIGPDGLC